MKNVAVAWATMPRSPPRFYTLVLHHPRPSLMPPMPCRLRLRTYLHKTLRVRTNCSSLPTLFEMRPHANGALSALLLVIPSPFIPLLCRTGSSWSNFMSCTPTTWDLMLQISSFGCSIATTPPPHLEPWIPIWLHLRIHLRNARFAPASCLSLLLGWSYPQRYLYPWSVWFWNCLQVQNTSLCWSGCMECPKQQIFHVRQ